MTIDTDLVLKIFDMQKDSYKNLTARVEKQTDAIVTIGHNVSNIKKDVEKHLEDSESVNECTEETEATVKKIWDKVKKMHKSVVTMIIVVLVTFSLMVLSYFFVRSTVETIVDKRLEQEEKLPGHHDELIKQIEDLKKQIENLNPPKDTPLLEQNVKDN